MKLSDKKMVKVIYLDSHILVAYKRGDLLTQKTDDIEPSLEEELKDWLFKKFNKKVFLHPIHRLDRSVAGLVLFARSSKALKRLNKMMKEKKIIRIYYGIVEGKISQKKGILKHHLLKESFKAKISEKGKVAELFFNVIEKRKDTTLVKIKLLTGRYHQIRAQFSAFGHPIVGDKKYGSKKDLKKIKLFSSYLEFIHPVSKEKMVFSLPLDQIIK